MPDLSGFLKFLAGFAAILAALLWLLHPYAVFNTDMETVYWMTAYEAASLKSSGDFAFIFHTPQIFGMPYPLFYAWGYILFNGAMVTFMGAAVAFRIMVFGALALQFFSTMRLCSRLGLPWSASYVLSCILAWSIYSLTNLYVRSAVMEYFAVSLLISSACCLLTIIVEGPSQQNRYEQVGWGFYFMLLSISHPITTYFGGFTLATCALLGLLFSPARRALLKNMALTFIGWTLVMLPWLYLMEKFVNKLLVSNWAGMASYYSWTYTDKDSWNIFFNSLWPLARAVWDPHVEPSGFDTQIAAALLIYLLGYLAARVFLPHDQIVTRGNSWLLNSLVAVGLTSALVYFLADCFHELYPYAVKLFARMQFSYRGVSYVNLWLFIAVVATLARTEFIGKRSKRWMLVTSLLAFLFATAGLVSKLNDALMYRSFEDHDDYSWITMKNVDVTRGPIAIPGPKDYAIIDGLTEYSLTDNPVVKVNFVPLPAPHLEDLAPQEIDLSQRSLVTTQILCFPWNKIYANGVEVNPDDLGFSTEVHSDLPTFVFWMKPGHYRLTYAFVPEPVYLILRDIGFIAFFAWVFVFAWLLFRPHSLKKPAI